MKHGKLCMWLANPHVKRVQLLLYTEPKCNDNPLLRPILHFGPFMLLLFISHIGNNENPPTKYNSLVPWYPLLRGFTVFVFCRVLLSLNPIGWRYKQTLFFILYIQDMVCPISTYCALQKKVRKNSLVFISFHVISFRQIFV